MIVESKIESGFIEIWLSKEEKNNDEVQQKVKNIIKENKKAKVIIFYSGEKDIYKSTEDILHINRKYS